MKNKLLGLFVFLLFVGATFAFTKLTKAQTAEPVTPVTVPSTQGHATGGVKAMMGALSFSLDFNAHAGPKGKVNYSDNTGTKFHGTVDQCYTQSGNNAVFAGTFDKGNVSNAYFVVAVQDNGQGKNASPDKLGVMFTDTVPTCVWDDSLLTAEVQKGNLVVHQ